MFFLGGGVFLVSVIGVFLCFFGGFFVGLPVLWSFLWFRVWDGG